MGESNQKQEQRFDPELLKKGLRCDLDQYEMLKRCSENEDVTEWNEWRRQNPYKEILLEGAQLQGAVLKGVNFYGAHLGGADLSFAHMGKSVLTKAHMKDATLSFSHLEGADLIGADLECAYMSDVYLQRARLAGVRLEAADLDSARLQGAKISNAFLQGAYFARSVVDGSTLLWDCNINRYDESNAYTDFSGVGLDHVQIDPATRQLLQYNIRRKNWEYWYRANKFWQWFVRLFWVISDYGLSTERIILTFFGLAFIFANIYYHWARLAPPGIVSNLLVDREGVAVQWWLVPLRTLYFSIVTQTTLGFGDMYAKGQSFFGHLLLMLQVLLGYVLLGALITRFAVLFTAGGPAGKFEEQKKKVDSVSPDNGIRGQISGSRGS